ncbi:MAG TPA: double zinc ribbon domain-containing protein [Gemmatimonadales bacterium]|nr:double zinc ribbon domain-containing protein [Gemmatimonadales bacterium]
MARFADLLPTFAAVERLLLPAECLLCLQPIPPREDDALVCGACRSRWLHIPPPWCARCGGPVGRDEPCTACAAWPPGLARVRSAIWLDDSARRAVHHLKYDGWWRVADAMALAMRGLEPLTGRLSLVPVPLGSRRFRKRGYNQSERIAAALSRGTGAPVRDVLRRMRETPSQTALTPEQRAANVAGAFTATAPLAGRCVLVDDVFTTGATLLAAAAALEAAGAEQVDAVTFARARNAVGQD